jgi:hypothetical protein
MSIPQPIGVAWFPIRWRDGSIRAWTCVDAEDFASVRDFTWRLMARRYAARSDGYGHVYLHRQLLGLQPGDGQVTDHINGNPLDNRRANLRVGTQAQNCQNCTALRGAVSSYRGVSFDSRPRRSQRPWRARVGKHWVGYFETELDAAHAASDARRWLLPYSNEDREDDLF